MNEEEELLRKFIIDDIKRLKLVPNKLLVVPDDLIAFEIFLFLPIEDILGNIVLCCKRFNFLVNNDLFWKFLLNREFPDGCPKCLEKINPWKKKYKNFNLIMSGKYYSDKQKLSDCVKFDNSFIISAIKNNNIPTLYSYLPDEIKNDKQITLEFIKKTSQKCISLYFEEIPINLLYDEDVVFELLKQDFSLANNLPNRRYKFLIPILNKLMKTK